MMCLHVLSGERGSRGEGRGVVALGDPGVLSRSAEAFLGPWATSLLLELASSALNEQLQG